MFTFADVFIFQPESPLDLLVWVPDRAGLLKAIDSFLDVVVAKLVQQGHKIPTGCRPIKGVESIAEGCGETSSKSKSENSQWGHLGSIQFQLWMSCVAQSELQSWLGLQVDFHSTKPDLLFPKQIIYLFKPVGHVVNCTN